MKGRKEELGIFNDEELRELLEPKPKEPKTRRQWNNTEAVKKQWEKYDTKLETWNTNTHTHTHYPLSSQLRCSIASV